MSDIEFFMPMKPPTITAQQHKVGNGRFYDPPELKVAKAKLRDNLIKHAPERPLDGPLRLIVKWCYPIKGKHQNGEYKATKPDTDNLNKALKDIMEDLGFFVNDSRIASEVIEKFWADLPGIYIRLEKL
ncbi:RusA family crossover junction endodeoxyribonuclease [Beduini massiliensis]|uniref:RusA family crossover junction endodeoxyribonuclease n=1 Tax=Beduini massiliensis TaxID=1585974 RepID=UPI00059A893A|nr:RusA family crossover junction endodeoxyribonuclease [Beduini massiliensis]